VCEASCLNFLKIGMESRGGIACLYMCFGNWDFLLTRILEGGLDSRLMFDVSAAMATLHEKVSLSLGEKKPFNSPEIG